MSLIIFEAASVFTYAWRVRTGKVLMLEKGKPRVIDHVVARLANETASPNVSPFWNIGNHFLYRVEVII